MCLRARTVSSTGSTGPTLPAATLHGSVGIARLGSCSKRWSLQIVRVRNQYDITLRLQTSRILSEDQQLISNPRTCDPAMRTQPPLMCPDNV